VSDLRRLQQLSMLNSCQLGQNTWLRCISFRAEWGFSTSIQRLALTESVFIVTKIIVHAILTLFYIFYGILWIIGPKQSFYIEKCFNVRDSYISHIWSRTSRFFCMHLSFIHSYILYYHRGTVQYNYFFENTPCEHERVLKGNLTR
jgi:hypothetical protein